MLNRDSLSRLLAGIEYQTVIVTAAMTIIQERECSGYYGHESTRMVLRLALNYGRL